MSAFWGITTFFDPTGSPLRAESYRRFRECSRRQGLPLVTVELAFGDAPFTLEPERDAEIVLHRRSSSVLWQKERLLNLALSALPPECHAVCWIDADILFDDDSWIEESEKLLSKFAVLQPFSVAVRLPRGADPADFPVTAIDRTVPSGSGDQTYSPSVCSKLGGLFPSFTGTTGYVWCARRTLLDEVRFYDRCVIGGGDREFALACAFAPGKIPSKAILNHYGRMREHLRPWHERVYEVVRGKVGYRAGVIHHLWHGDAQKRRYGDRHALLEEHGYDPERDLSLDEGGCWRWATENQGLREAVLGYFSSREEEG